MKIKEIFKQPILYILIICIAVQAAMYTVWQEYCVTNDTSSYIDSYQGNSFFKGHVDENRTPIYPYFIKIVKKIGGEENLKENIVFMQKILFLMSVCIFYYALKTITKNKILLTIATLIFGITPALVSWNAMLLTEPLAIFETVLLVFFTLQYLKKESKISAIFIHVIILIMVLTRPAFIYLLPIYFIFWIIRFFTNQQERKSIIAAFISMAIVVVLLIGYCFLVKMNYGHFGLTAISNVNSEVTAITSGSYLHSKNEALKNRTYELVGEKPSEDKVWNVLWTLQKEYPSEELAAFAKETLYRNKEYYKYLFNKVIVLSTMNIGIVYNNNSPQYQNQNFKIYDLGLMGNMILPINFGMIYLLLLGTIVYLIYYLIKYKKIDWILAFCTILILANLFTAVVGAPFETQRLFVVAIILVIVEITYIVDNIVKNRKNEK